ncbi:MAG: hypothetical protein KAU14_07325 [Thermoplasmata archaeon]|nr:hypothetical protein [Thermoplasmata archaeon]
MGLIYRPIRISSLDEKNSKNTVALVDTGCDESVISERIARKIDAGLYGIFKTVSASQHEMTGSYADVILYDLADEIGGQITVGVSDEPFDVDEGIEVILGVDFLQENSVKLDLRK